MKRFSALLFTLLLLLSGCSSKVRTDVTPDEIVAVYEAAGYTVWSEMYDEKLDYGEIGYIQANHPDGDYIYFSIFESEEDAESYKKEFYHPGMLGLFSVIFGDPSWMRSEVYGCIVVEYDNPVLYEPLEELLKST